MSTKKQLGNLGNLNNLSGLIIKDNKKADITGRIYLPVGQIHIDPNQPRYIFDEDKMIELTASVLADGVRQAISVRKVDAESYIINTGARRFEAAKRAGLTEVPVTIDEKYDFVDQISENLNRDDLTQVELADAFHKAITELGLKQSDLVKRTGLSKGQVSKLCSVGKFVDEVKDLLKDQRIELEGASRLNSLFDEDLDAYNLVIEAVNQSSESFTRKGLHDLIDAHTKKSEVVIDIVEEPVITITAEQESDSESALDVVEEPVITITPEQNSDFESALDVVEEPVITITAEQNSDFESALDVAEEPVITITPEQNSDFESALDVAEEPVITITPEQNSDFESALDVAEEKENNKTISQLMVDRSNLLKLGYNTITVVYTGGSEEVMDIAEMKSDNLMEESSFTDQGILMFSVE